MAVSLVVCEDEDEDGGGGEGCTMMFFRFCCRTSTSSWRRRAPLWFIALMKRVAEIKARSISCARPEVMKRHSFGPRYMAALASKLIRSLFSSMIAGEAEDGGANKTCGNSVAFVEDGGVAGRAEGDVLLERLRVTMWIAPQRMSMCRVSKAVRARS